MAQKTRAQNLAQIAALINDNTTQDITPAKVRTVHDDELASMPMYQQLTRSALQAIITAVAVEEKCLYEISDAVSSKRIIVFGFDSSTISTLALNLTDNEFGNYDITGNTFTPLPTGSLPDPSTFPGFVQGNTQALTHDLVTDTYAWTDLG